MADLHGRELVEYVDTHLDRSMDRLDKGMDPIWAAQSDMGKTVISLSSGTLVLSISVAQYLGPREVQVDWPTLLPVAWVLFAVSVLCATIRQSWVSQARALRAHLALQRATIRKQLWDLVPGPTFATDVDRILESAITAAADKTKKGIKIHDALNQVMFWSFAVGLGALVVFAIKNLTLNNGAV